jgi:hypothetical protein
MFGCTQVDANIVVAKGVKDPRNKLYINFKLDLSSFPHHNLQKHV